MLLRFKPEHVRAETFHNSWGFKSFFEGKEEVSLLYPSLILIIDLPPTRIWSLIPPYFGKATSISCRITETKRRTGWLWEPVIGY